MLHGKSRGSDWMLYEKEAVSVLSITPQPACQHSILPCGLGAGKAEFLHVSSKKLDVVACSLQPMVVAVAFFFRLVNWRYSRLVCILSMFSSLPALKKKRGGGCLDKRVGVGLRMLHDYAHGYQQNDPDMAHL